MSEQTSPEAVPESAAAEVPSAPTRRRAARAKGPSPAPADSVPAEPAETGAPPVASAPRTADRIEVERLDFERGAIGGVKATDVAVRQAVVGGIAAGRASVEFGLVNAMAAREATLQQGVVRGVVAQSVHLEQAIVRSVVANRVETGPTTAIVVALARRIDGEARILLDWRGALALGAVLGVAYAAVRLLRRS
jgi:hypothetical protein